MKKNFVLAALALAAFVVPSTAFGAASVYFRIAGDAGSNSAGNVLVIDDAGPGSVNIEMVADVTDVSLFSVSTTLRNAGPGSAALSGLVSNAPLGGAPTPPTAINAGPVLAQNFGAATFSGPGFLGPDIVLSTFTLDYDGEGSITAEIGNLLWAQSNFLPADVQFADGPLVSGGQIGAGGNTVISIVPEPATLSLLGLGAVALIRRRR